VRGRAGGREKRTTTTKKNSNTVTTCPPWLGLLLVPWVGRRGKERRREKVGEENLQTCLHRGFDGLVFSLSFINACV
jgi:hypothetical protein